MVFYEIGTLTINTDILNKSQVRVVAFLWLQDLLAYIGFEGRLLWIAPPVMVVVILLGLQIASRKSWTVYFNDFAPMFLECVLMAIPLVVFSLVISQHVHVNRSIDQIFESNRTQDQCTVQALQSSVASSEQPQAPEETNPASILANIVTGIGAGIYEELVFRLILICVLMMLFQDIIGWDHKGSIILSIFISASLFSAHHHFIFLTGRFFEVVPFSFEAFLFRAVAGIYFAALFAGRGFGITAGTHAFYDMMATLVNALLLRI